MTLVCHTIGKTFLLSIYLLLLFVGGGVSLGRDRGVNRGTPPDKVGLYCCHQGLFSASSSVASSGMRTRVALHAFA